MSSFIPSLRGSYLTAVNAAVMSTADSQLLLASGIATTDLPLIKTFAHGLTEKARVWLGRLLLVVIGSIAAAISILHPTTIFSLVAYAWGGMGSAFGPVTILALYWRGFNLAGAAASILAGTATASLRWFLRGDPLGIWDVDPATPGFIVSMLGILKLGATRGTTISVEVDGDDAPDLIADFTALLSVEG